MKILECSTAGDKRFSALCATVHLFGKVQCIEEWYQFSKDFGMTKVLSWTEVKKFSKFMKIIGCNINGKRLDVRYLTQWYKILWLIYLDRHPDLVQYAAQFDSYSDKFRGKSVNCQADVIRQYIKDGRESVYKDCEELVNILNLKGVV